MLYPVLLFFDISAGELMVILLAAFVIFGPSKIPEVARKIGRGINEVRRASDEIKREITKETRKVESSFSMDDFDLSDTKKTVKKPKTEPLTEKNDIDKPEKPAKDGEDKPSPAK